jgi:hypothetical protein
VNVGNLPFLLLVLAVKSDTALFPLYLARVGQILLQQTYATLSKA